MALQGIADNGGAAIILWSFPADLAAVLGDVTGGDSFTLTRESYTVWERSKTV